MLIKKNKKNHSYSLIQLHTWRTWSPITTLHPLNQSYPRSPNMKFACSNPFSFYSFFLGGEEEGVTWMEVQISTLKSRCSKEISNHTKWSYSARKSVQKTCSAYQNNYEIPQFIFFKKQQKEYSSTSTPYLMAIPARVSYLVTWCSMCRHGEEFEDDDADVDDDETGNTFNDAILGLFSTPFSLSSWS